MPAGPSKHRITSAAVVHDDVQANDIALDESAFMGIPQAPPATTFEDVGVGLAQTHVETSFVLGPGPLDPSMPQQHFAGPSSFGGDDSGENVPEFASAFSEVGPSSPGGNRNGAGQAQDGNELSGDDDESSDASSDSDDSDSD